MSYANTWPAELPLPMLGTQGQPTHPTLASSLDSARIQRRARRANGGVNLSLRWTFTVAQYDAFRVFFQDDLGNGASAFLLDLKYPRTSALDTWLVRFNSSVTVTPMAAMFEVAASVYLIHKEEAENDEVQPPLDFEDYLVMVDDVESSGESSSSAGGGFEQYVVSGVHPYSVKI